MLGKLFKYDNRALARILVPANIIIAAIGVLACAVAALYVNFPTHALPMVEDATMQSPSYVEPDIYEESFDVYYMQKQMLMMFLFMLVGLLCVAPAVPLVVAVHRIYKNFFTDEGYLTLTLPVSEAKLVLSKFLASFLWIAITFALSLFFIVASLSLFEVSSGYGGGKAVYADSFVWSVFSIIGSGVFSFETSAFESGFYVVSGVIQTYLSICAQVVIYGFAFVLGAAVTPRHKAVAGFGFAFLLNQALSIMSIVIVTPLMVLGDDGNFGGIIFVNELVYLVAVTICWAMSVYLLKRKINLL